MMRGRKPKPTRMKQLAGNPGRRKLNTSEPKPSISADIGSAAIGESCRTFRDRYLPMLQNLKVLTDADLAAFELMSVHYAIAWRAAEIVQKKGLTIKVQGVLHKHPLLQVFRDNSAAFRAYAAEFGMTPSARSRIKVEEAEQLSLAEILFSDAKPVEHE